MNNRDFIWTKGQCLKAYDEMIIKIAMSSYAELEGQELLDENEQLKKSPQFQVTPQVERKIRHTVLREFSRESVYQIVKGFYRVASKAAVVFLAVVIAFGTTMAVSAEFRSAIYKLVFTYEKQYTLIELDSKTELEFVGAEVYTWKHAFAPTMMPQGYAVTDVLTSSITNTVIYTNTDGKYIEFFQDNGMAEGSIQVDTEDAQLVQTIYINDCEGIFVSKNGLSTLFWRVGNCILSLESNEDMDVLISIAKNIKLFK